ncbi:Metallo-dependent hydrolase, partial [Punctularia strigosozonata HHB-11173 SS5]|uniref:Metallo-dependent hydrolase n=1 Tax=Punctularia strigosozonata (strain HHB-11173) TaxID=741275 RepID=UPI00044173BA
MATRESDQKLVAQLAREYPDKVIPCFGFHPWFTHLISVKAADSLPPVEEHYRELFDPTDPAQEEAFGALLPHLPAPTPLSAILDNVRAHLLEFPSAMLGEVGIDRSARIAHSYAANPRFLSPFTIPTEHQLAILEAQLDLAVELGRSVSLHSVKAQQITVDLLNRLKAKHGHAWLEINVDLHSCGLSSETWKRIQSQHPNVYISLSVGINSRSPNHVALIKAAAPERILAESDYHTAAQSGPMTWRMIGVIAQNRGWGVEEEWSYAEDDVAIGVHKSGWGAVRRLEHNWKAFVHGRH